MAETTFQIGLLQRSCGTDPAAARESTLAGIREAAGAGAQIICTQELFGLPYFCQTEDPANFELAEAIPGPTTEAVAGIAREEEVVVVACLFERRAAGVYHNTAVVLDADGTTAGIYRKMHIPDDPRFHEKFYFAPGDTGFPVFATRFGRIGVLICWDQWYPEAARLAALGGADVLFYPSAIGWLPEEKEESGEAQLEAWQTVQRAHAIANGMHVAAVNRVGREEKNGGAVEFWGSSFVADPLGRLLHVASREEEATVVADVDLGLAEEVRREWPFLRDRRIDAYEGIGKRFLDP